MSLSTILCKTKNFQTWNEECLIYVILGIKFEKLLPYLKSALLSQSKCKVPRKDKNLKIWDKKCSFLDIFKLKSLKSSYNSNHYPQICEKASRGKQKSFNFETKNGLFV